MYKITLHGLFPHLFRKHAKNFCICIMIPLCKGTGIFKDRIGEDSGIHVRYDTDLQASSDIFRLGTLAVGIGYLCFPAFVRTSTVSDPIMEHHIGDDTFCQSFAHVGKVFIPLVGNGFKHANSIFFLDFRRNMWQKTVIRRVVCHLEVGD